MGDDATQGDYDPCGVIILNELSPPHADDRVRDGRPATLAPRGPAQIHLSLTHGVRGVHIPCTVSSAVAVVCVFAYAEVVTGCLYVRYVYRRRIRNRRVFHFSSFRIVAIYVATFW